MNLEEQLINAFKDKPISQKCLKKTNSPMLGVLDPPKDPCELLEKDNPKFKDAQFEIENLNERDLCFLAIDQCVLPKKGGKRCDFAIFSENEFVFVELKLITSTNPKTVKQRHEYARTQLESTISIFSDKNINLSDYKKNYKLFAVVSVLLDLNPPVTKKPVPAASQNMMIYAEENMGIIWAEGHSYTFS